MFEKFMQSIMNEHRGKALGILLGFIASILFVSYGFWPTIFIVLCIFVGYQVGKKLDENVDLEEWLRNLFNVKK